MKTWLLCVVLTLLTTTVALPARAQAPASVNGPDSLATAKDLSLQCSTVFREVMDSEAGGIPQSVIDAAEVVAVFPNVVKDGLIIGSKGVAGIASIRDMRTRQWGAPIFLKLGGGSISYPNGAKNGDLILIGSSRALAHLFLQDYFTVGAVTTAVAGPLGTQTTPTGSDALLCYARSGPYFDGVAIRGTRIWQDNSINEAVYGSGKIDLVMPVSGRVPAGVLIFTQTLNSFTGESRV